MSIVGNLDKPETEALVPLNFEMASDFAEDFKIAAAHRGIDRVQQLYEASAAAGKYELSTESMK
jgi:hypothetical protein